MANIVAKLPNFSTGTITFIKESIVEDISNFPYWLVYKCTHSD